MGYFFALLLGVIVGAAAMRHYARWRAAAEMQAYVENLLRDVREDRDEDLAQAIETAPAVDPDELPDVVDFTKASEEEESEGTESMVPPVPNEKLRALLEVLADWRPRSRDGSERGYERSLRNALRKPSFPHKFHEQLRITLGGRRWIQPDFVVTDVAPERGKQSISAAAVTGHDNILVELKGNLTTTATGDRSMGQILRYLLYWKKYGPGVLVICGSIDSLMRLTLASYVRVWKRDLRIPVIVVYARELRRVPAGAVEEVEAVAAHAAHQADALEAASLESSSSPVS